MQSSVLNHSSLLDEQRGRKFWLISAQRRRRPPSVVCSTTVLPSSVRPSRSICPRRYRHRLPTWLQITCLMLISTTILLFGVFAADEGQHIGFNYVYDRTPTTDTAPSHPATGAEIWSPDQEAPTKKEPDRPPESVSTLTTAFEERFATVTERNRPNVPPEHYYLRRPGQETVHYVKCVDFDRMLNERAPKDNPHNITRILDSLVNNYDKRLRPNYGGPPVEVLVSIHVLTIGAVSEVDMDYTLDIYLRQFWTDSRLNFSGLNESLTIGIDMVNSIWVPDTFFQNEKKSFFHEATTHNSFLRIDPKGNVLRSIRLTITANCPMGLQYFPLDTQNCSFEIESYGYSTKDIIYYWTPKSPVSIDDNVHLAQFNVKEFEHKQRVIGLTTGSYSRLTVFFIFERNVGFYLIQIYLPATLIVVISWVSFWLNRDATQARVAVGVTTVLTMTTLMTSTNAAMPKVSYVKSIDIYLGTCFFFVFASLLEYATVGYALKWTKRRPPPGIHDMLVKSNYGTLPGFGVGATSASVATERTTTTTLTPGQYLAPTSSDHNHNPTTAPNEDDAAGETAFGEDRRLSQTPRFESSSAALPAYRKYTRSDSTRSRGGPAEWGMKFRGHLSSPASAGGLYTDDFVGADEHFCSRAQLLRASSASDAAPPVRPLLGPTMPLLDARYRTASAGNLWRSEPDLSVGGGGGSGGYTPGVLNICCCRLPRPSSIDKASRWGFPLSFIIFQCIYWTYYLVLGQIAYKHKPTPVL